jgi:uncharacterized protein YjbI with pentapeptide repeats
MVSRIPGPRAPREVAPDLPRQLEAVTGLSPRGEVIGVDVRGLDGEVSAAHGRIAESRLDDATVTRLDVTGAVLGDVAVHDLRAVELVARDASWRTVEIVGGRIGTLDGLRASWDGVVLRGLRIDYLSLPSAELADVRVVGCDIGTLDVPEATLARVRFEDCRADEVDTRGLRGTDLDLRGLEALSFTDAAGLRGATLLPRQVELHAVAFAHALGVRVEDGEGAARG